MWNPPIALTSEEQKIAARTRKTRKFFVFLREHRHELLGGLDAATRPRAQTRANDIDRMYPRRRSIVA